MTARKAQAPAYLQPALMDVLGTLTVICFRQETAVLPHLPLPLMPINRPPSWNKRSTIYGRILCSAQMTSAILMAQMQTGRPVRRGCGGFEVQTHHRAFLIRTTATLHLPTVTRT